MKLTRKLLRESLIKEINSQALRCEREDIIINNIPVNVEIANTPELRDRGLMFRKSMPENEGMLFDFFNDEDRGFWMKNTTIPLSIAFIDSSGTISNIEQMEPNSLNSAYSKKPCRYALEMNQGWFSENDIHPGSKCLIRQ